MNHSPIDPQDTPEFAIPMPAPEQATDERTFEDALAYLKSAEVILGAIVSITGGLPRTALAVAHDSVIKAYNTVAFLKELTDTPRQLFTQADVQAAWQDGYEAAYEELE